MSTLQRNEILYRKLSHISVDPTDDNKISYEKIQKVFEENDIDISVADGLFGGSAYITTQQYILWQKSLHKTHPKFEEEKKSHSDDFSPYEYACKRCIRPIGHNVFMEKNVDECSSAEMEYEVERLICCLHFLSENLNIYKTLAQYLSEINKKNEQNSSSDDKGTGFLLLSQPTAKNLKSPTNHNNNYQHHVKSDTVQHIKWLHTAYIENAEQRRKNLKKVNNKAPNFEQIISKKSKLRQMYAHYQEIWHKTMSELSEKYFDERHDRMINDENEPFEDDNDNDNDMIERMDSMNSMSYDEYLEDPSKYDPIYSATPTRDEMECYLSLCQIIFNESVSSGNLSNIGNIQKIQQSFAVLRKNDNAIASKTEGWVTTIDNVLCVLMYRDFAAYRKNFVGELLVTMVVEGSKNSSLQNFENRALLKVIKQSLIYSFCGVPIDSDAATNCFEIHDIILRNKENERSVADMCMCESNHLVRLTFGIQCDDERIGNFGSYKFMYQSKRLFEQIHKNNTFIKLFDSKARKLRAQIKLTEIHTYDLDVLLYEKSDLDISLTQKHQLNRIDTNEDSFNVHTIYAAETPKQQSLHQTVEDKFLHCFDSQNLKHLADTSMFEDEMDTMFESKMVGWLNKILFIFNPSIIYSKVENAETPKGDALDPKANTSQSLDESKYTNLEKSNIRKGHKLCCGLCYVSFSMIAFALIMAIIVGIGGLNIWLIGYAPMRATIEHILQFTNGVLSDETNYIAQRSIFSCQQFIDFTSVLPSNVVTNYTNSDFFDNFLNDELIASPKFDGIIFINGNQNESNFVFKHENNTKSEYKCQWNVSQSCEHSYLWNISDSIWSNKDFVANEQKTDIYFINASIWFIRWKYVKESDYVIGAMFDGKRINEEYNALALAKEGIVYWMTNDIHRDVFVTSSNNDLLHVSPHNASNSSIHLHSSFGYAVDDEYKQSAVDDRIKNTMNQIDFTNTNGSIDDGDYYIYYTLINSSSTSFGSFYIVVAFPFWNVYQQLNVSYYVIIISTIIAMIFAMINAVTTNAVPFVPPDDSWLAVPLFTEQDKKELNDTMEMGIQLGQTHHQSSPSSPRRKAAASRSPLEKSPTQRMLSNLTKGNASFKPMIVHNLDIEMGPIGVTPRSSANSVMAMNSPNSMKSEHDFMYDEEQKFNRQRSNSDGAKSKRDHHKIDSKADAIQKLKALSNIVPNDDDNDNVNTVALKQPNHIITKANSMNLNNEQKDMEDIGGSDDDDAPIPMLNKSMSVATGLKSRNSTKRSAEEQKRRRTVKKKLNLWKKKQQKDQLQRNINHANMRSIFSRQNSEFRTSYAQRMNFLINLFCCIVAGLIVFSYLSIRALSNNDITLLMNTNLIISNLIIEQHAEFKVYEHALALQHGQLLIDNYATEPYDDDINDELLYNFYSVFDDLTAIFSFYANDSNEIDWLTMYASNENENNECVEIDFIEDSFLASCIKWKECEKSLTYSNDTNLDNMTDCTMYRSIEETFDFYILANAQNTIAWSLPFVCFGGSTICYVGLTKSQSSSLFIGALLTLDGVADTAEHIIWQSSGMNEIVQNAVAKIPTAVTGYEPQFSFYLFTELKANDTNNKLQPNSSSAFFAQKYALNNDYLLACKDNEVIISQPSAYGAASNAILSPDQSSNEVVKSTYKYLKATHQTNDTNNNDNNAQIIYSAWSYPKIVYYAYQNEYGLNWICVITISAEIFIGDYSAYTALGAISVMGWLIIYLFIHYLSYRRFKESIFLWELRYQQQIEEEMFPLLLIDDDDSADSENNMNINDNVSDVDSFIDQFEDDDLAQMNNKAKKPLAEVEEEEQTLHFISANIRSEVRKSCRQSWIRHQQTNEISADLPTKRKDITDHYHKRALRHIHQAKRGMNIITVVQMEQQSNHKILNLYRLHSSRGWMYSLQVLQFFHIWLVFWRPLTANEIDMGYFEQYSVQFILEWIFILIEFIDLSLTFCIQFKWQNANKNPLMSPSLQRKIFCLRGIIWCLILIDMALLSAHSQFAFSRFIPLRPFLLILSNDKLIGACYALAITSINAADALLLFVMLLFIASISGLILFRFDELMSFYNVYSFQNMIRSIWTSYIFIISGENYTELVYISFEKSEFLIIYFIILTVLGSWIVVSLVVSRFQTSFKEIYNRERQRRVYFKRTGYVAAFSLINLDDDNEVSHSEFEAFVKYIREQTKRINAKKANDKHKYFQHQSNVDSGIGEELEMLKNLNFDTFDEDGDDCIDIREFVTKLEEIYRKPALIDVINDDETLLAWIRLNIVETEAFSQFVLMIILIELILFSLFGIYPGLHNTKMLDLMLGITVLLNGLDIGVKIFSSGWDYYWNTSKCRIIHRHKGGREESVYTQNPLTLKEREFAHRFDLLIVAFALFGFVGSRIAVDQLWFEDSANSARIVLVIPLFRLFTLIKTTRSAVYIITRVIPRFASLVILLSMLFYIYAVIGVWLIGDALSLLLEKPQYTFATFEDSLITLFQLTVGEGWHDIMYSTVYAANSLLSTTWYFISFVLIITLIFTNLFVGLVISVVDDTDKQNKTQYAQLQQLYSQNNKEQMQQQQQQQQDIFQGSFTNRSKRGQSIPSEHDLLHHPWTHSNSPHQTTMLFSASAGNSIQSRRIMAARAKSRKNV